MLPSLITAASVTMSLAQPNGASTASICCTVKVGTLTLMPLLVPFCPAKLAVTSATAGDSVSRLSETIAVAVPFASATVAGCTSPQLALSVTDPEKPAAGAPLPSSARTVSGNGSCSLTLVCAATTSKPQAAAASLFTH